jgi:hypothetical protein
MAQEDPPRKKLLKMITGYWQAQAIHVAAKLGIADLIEKAPRSAAELAKETKTDPQSLYRLLRALASVEIFAEDEQRRFSLTPLAECLLDRHGSQRAVAIMMGDEHFRAWGDVLYSVQTGKPAFDHVHGMGVFDYYSKHPEEAKIFDAAMTGFHGPETQAMVDAYDFSGINTLVDVGGGNGTVISTILRKYPALKGIIERAKVSLQLAGLAQRCQTVSGSFFESVPEGGDAYLMRHIIHDWTDEQCRTILGNCRKVMKPGHRLLVIEMVVPPGNEPGLVKFLDLNMLVIPGGQERTEAEYRQLFASTGFKLTRVVPTTTEVSVIEGAPE